LSHTTTGHEPALASTRNTVDAVLHAGGRLHLGVHHVDLAPLDARLVEALLARRGNWCPAGVLLAAGWPAGADRRQLTARLLVLNRRLRGVGLRVVTHPDRGAALDVNPNGAST
jgi:hypothetical protein